MIFPALHKNAGRFLYIYTNFEKWVDFLSANKYNTISGRQEVR